MLYSGNTRPFQGRAVGSIPITRSNNKQVSVVDTHVLPAVALSEFKLRLSGVLLALVPDIAAYDAFVDADSGDEKSLCPDALAVPVDLGQEVRKFLPEFLAGHGLERSHDL